MDTYESSMNVKKNKISTIIVKTNRKCTLNCLYCYERDKEYKEDINIRTVVNIIGKIASYNSSSSPVTFIWHGGEPLLQGIGFYKQILKTQQSLGKDFTFKNSIQTNGTLLSHEFIEFFASNNFRIGISLDGPPEIHNNQRIFSNGEGSFERVLSAIERIRVFNKNCPNKIQVAALAVLTKNTLLHIDEFYEFFRDIQMDVQINCVILPKNAKSSLDNQLYITSGEYGEAMIYLFDRWLKESEYKFSIHPFSNILRSFVSGYHQSCMFSGRCYLDYLSIDPVGNIVPCGRWSKNQFCYGNINTDNFDDALNSPDFHRYTTERSQVAHICSKCQHFDICKGGCAYSTYINTGKLSGPDYYCTGYKMLFDHVKKVVKEEIGLSS